MKLEYTVAEIELDKTKKKYKGEEFNLLKSLYISGHLTNQLVSYFMLTKPVGLSLCI